MTNCKLLLSSQREFFPIYQAIFFFVNFPLKRGEMTEWRVYQQALVRGGGGVCICFKMGSFRIYKEPKNPFFLITRELRRNGIALKNELKPFWFISFVVILCILFFVLSGVLSGSLMMAASQGCCPT